MDIYRLATVKDLAIALKKDKPVYLDTETSKLGSQIRLIQVYQEGWEQVLELDTMDVSALTAWIVLQPHHLVGHNLTYDLGCFKKDLPEGVFEMPKKWDDTFYATRIKFPQLNTSGGFSLDKALTYVLGYDPYKKEGLNKANLQKSFERLMVKGVYIEGKAGLKELTNDQLLYAAIDVYELPHLWNAVKDVADQFVYQLDILTVGHIQQDVMGLPLDLEELSKLEKADHKLIASLTKLMPAGLNVNSYMQVRKVLGTVMSSDEIALTLIQNRPEGLDGIKIRTKMGQSGKFPTALIKGITDNTIKVVISNFGDEERVTHPDNLPTSTKVLVYYYETNYVASDEVVLLAGYINDTRKALKRLNFAERARKAYTVKHDSIPRIQGTFSPHAINGRIQVDNENLSQYPRTMKKMWGHPKGNGRKLIYSDFAQVELRIICAALPEMNMYGSLKQGVDLHTFVGNNLGLTEADLAHLPAGISPRFIAKQCNFLLLYGGGVANFQQTVCKLGGVWFNGKIAKKITTNWKEVFSDIRTWHKKNSASKTNMDETVSGKPYKASTLTDLNNIRVSGTGSEIFKLWLHYIEKYILSVEEDIYLVNRVHDSVIIDAPDNPEIYERISKNLVLCAQKAWFEIIKNAPLVDVPMPCDVSVGSNWEDIEYEKDLDYAYTLDGMYMFDKELDKELL